MWKVIYTDKNAPTDAEPVSVITANPEADIKRFMFKDAAANIKVMFNGELRREYKDGVIVKDVIEYPRCTLCCTANE